MTPADIFHRLLDETAAIIAHPGALALPSDELHTEILLPLLPAMLRDRAIREAWRGQKTRGFFARMAASREGGCEAPRWEAGDFEIHVTASYLAGPDAKALADTLLSEDSLREMTASLMNQILAIVWPALPPHTPAEARVEVALPVPPLAPAEPEPVAAEEIEAAVAELIEEVESGEAVPEEETEEAGDVTAGRCLRPDPYENPIRGALFQPRFGNWHQALKSCVNPLGRPGWRPPGANPIAGAMWLADSR